VKTKCMSEYRSLASHPQCGGARKLLFDEFFIFDIFPLPPPVDTVGMLAGGKNVSDTRRMPTIRRSAVARARLFSYPPLISPSLVSRRFSFCFPLARYEYPLNKCAAAGALFVHSVVYLLLMPDKRNNGEHSRRSAFAVFSPPFFQPRKCRCARARVDAVIKGHFVSVRFLFRTNFHGTLCKFRSGKISLSLSFFFFFSPFLFFALSTGPVILIDFALPVIPRHSRTLNSIARTLLRERRDSVSSSFSSLSSFFFVFCLISLYPCKMIETFTGRSVCGECITPFVSPSILIPS